ncbi:MAG TPA: hypothetical protein VK399_04045, partial [Longimicrobiaceae bacterium]|nr:hypothetical protein [Longimicrobiaceae bacterium]
PDLLTVPIAGNDDAIRSVGLISGAIADVIVEARASMPADARRAADEAEVTTYSTETGAAAPSDKDDRGGKGRRPRRKRKPRPEAIANARGGEGGDAAEGGDEE